MEFPKLGIGFNDRILISVHDHDGLVLSMATLVEYPLCASLCSHTYTLLSTFPNDLELTKTRSPSTASVLP